MEETVAAHTLGTVADWRKRGLRIASVWLNQSFGIVAAKRIGTPAPWNTTQTARHLAVFSKDASGWLQMFREHWVSRSSGSQSEAAQTRTRYKCQPEC